uniref:Uncharacterized protein n=1 Tax=Anopheles maculatus TaxID=74869 RepID=A0A182T9A7_9DIPT
MRSLLTLFLCVVTVHAQLDTFDYCIRMTPSPGILQCAGQQALSSLQFLEEASNFTLASGVLMIKDESLVPSSRIIPNIVDHDPLDFRQVTVRNHSQLTTPHTHIHAGTTSKSVPVGPKRNGNAPPEWNLCQSVPNWERTSSVYAREHPN